MSIYRQLRKVVLAGIALSLFTLQVNAGTTQKQAPKLTIAAGQHRTVRPVSNRQASSKRLVAFVTARQSGSLHLCAACGDVILPAPAEPPTRERNIRPGRAPPQL